MRNNACLFLHWFFLNVQWGVKEEHDTICTFQTSQSYDLAPKNMFLGKLCTHSPTFYLWDRGVLCACMFVCVGQIKINRVTGRGYRALGRTHKFGLRGTKPCLQWHLNEPMVFWQRAFLHRLLRTPGSAHSSISVQRVREWSSLKPGLHSHMVPRYEGTQRPLAQLHSSESSSELSPGL